VVQATMTLVETKAQSGIYHCVNSGWTTWSGLARELAAIVDKPAAAITDVRMSDVQLVAQRPKFAALSNDKLSLAGVEMPTWQSALRRYVQSLTDAT
jgi:dTDP-4-dehydrorhamnose reductase